MGEAASLRFNLPSSGDVAIRVYDARGAEVARPVDGSFTAGEHTTGLVATEFASGTYFAKLWFDGEVLATTKLTIVK